MTQIRRFSQVLIVTCLALTVAGCASNGTAVEPNTEAPVSSEASIIYGDRFPEVLRVATSPVTGAVWRFEVTLLSTYDTPERYADAWRVLDATGTELGIRVLTHDHQNEQPFTRSHTIEIPEDTRTVFVEGRDQANGWSGQRFPVTLTAS